MQYPHAYHTENTTCPTTFHYHYDYLIHCNYEHTDASAHPHYPLDHLVLAENRHPHHLYAHHPYYHTQHPHHHTYHPQYHASVAHPSTQDNHQVILPYHYSHDHDAHQSGHAGHVLHFKKIIATSDITKPHWVWHITDHRKTVIKTSEHIHRSFEDCVRDARHYDTKLIVEHKDIGTTSWAWVITDHHGTLVKKSTTIHATFIKCVQDVDHHSVSHDHSMLAPYHYSQADHAGHTLHIRKVTATSDTTSVHWVWHISNHRKEVIKTSEHILSSFEECVRNARHYDAKLVIEHKDIENSSWAWVVTNHHGVLVKKSTAIHATFIKCIEDLHLHDLGIH